MRTILKLYTSHGTKILGFLTMVVAGLPEVEGLVEPGHRKYWTAANIIIGAITVQRGVTNTRNSQ